MFRSMNKISSAPPSFALLPASPWFSSALRPPSSALLGVLRSSALRPSSRPSALSSLYTAGRMLEKRVIVSLCLTLSHAKSTSHPGKRTPQVVPWSRYPIRIPRSQRVKKRRGAPPRKTPRQLLPVFTISRGAPSPNQKPPLRKTDSPGHAGAAGNSDRGLRESCEKDCHRRNMRQLSYLGGLWR